MQAETLEDLLNRLKVMNISELEFKDIQIKSAELIKQLFPYDSATAIYNINILRVHNGELYNSIAALI
jgi:hypothetical protein